MRKLVAVASMLALSGSLGAATLSSIGYTIPLRTA